MNSDCTLCLEVSGKHITEDCNEYVEAINTQRNIITSSTNFIVVPSLGPLNESHAMLVPKKHVNSFALLTADEVKEGFSLLERIKKYTATEKGEELIFFESGAGSLVSHSGGCVTHAHIHCLRKNEWFETSLRDEVNLKKVEHLDFSETDVDYGYIWYQNEKSDSYICNRPLLPSQFLRYLYAKPLGSDTKWNWRKNINIPGVMSVIDYYQNL